MKQSKIIHYKIPVSVRFPAGHFQAGKQTYFIEKIERAFMCGKPINDYLPKLHTIRGNYPLWVKRMEKVHAGLAVIDICYWKLPGGRYTPGNELIPFVTLDKDSGCGVQKIEFKPNHILAVHFDITQIDNYIFNPLFVQQLSHNDGMTITEFRHWFKSYDLTKPMAIIHFTAFRY